jgi:MraZ protein
MFMGEYEHSIDAKGRIIIPSRFRDDLGDKFFVTVGLDGCLFLYPKDAWEAFSEELSKLPGTKEARQLQRTIFGRAAACEVDKQGRILIPATLREAASLEKDVVFVGVLNKIELWSKERYKDNSDIDNMDTIAEHVAQFGIRF